VAHLQVHGTHSLNMLGYGSHWGYLPGVSLWLSANLATAASSTCPFRTSCCRDVEHCTSTPAH